MKLALLLVAAAVVAVLACHRRPPERAPFTVADRLKEFGPAVGERMKPFFAAAGIPYPPNALVLVALKQEERLELFARGGNEGAFKFVREYPILAASGELGPKLREGDRQVPEGLYEIEALNPNSRFHLSLRVNYPNAFDREQAAREQRTKLGGDIMIHGNAVSIGCLAMGDETAEELFVLAALTGLKNIRVLLSPLDFRVSKTVPLPASAPAWAEATLYPRIREELSKYKRTGQ